MLQSPFKSMLARTAIFALVLALAISFVTVGLAPSATAQSADDDPCKADTNADPVTVACSYDENDDASVANFSGMDPEGEMIIWSLAGPDAPDFDITGGVLSFKKAPNYESPTDRLRAADTTVTPNIPEEAATNNVYLVDVVATEVRAPGSLDLAQSTTIKVTVTVMNIEEDPTLTLDRLQVRAPNADGSVAGNPVTAAVTDPDTRSATGTTVDITPTYMWYVPKVSRPDLENDDHWNLAGNATARETAAYTPAAGDVGKYLRVVATYTDQAGDPDKAYARSAYPVGVARSADDNNAPSFPDGTPSGFTVREDTAVGTVVGTVTGSDVDSNDVLTHALTGDLDDGLFKINPVTGQITVGMELDFETATDRNTDADADGTQYRVTVTVYDSLAEAPPTRDIDITVTDVNDAPGNADQGTTTVLTMVAENHVVEDDDTADPAEIATVLRTYTVTDTTDEDAGDNIAAITLSLGGTDGDLFSLTDEDGDSADVTGDDNTYELRFRESPDYESPADADGNNRYHVTVITSDNEGASSSRALVIEVTNVDEEGKVALSTIQPAVGQAITATLTDPDMKISEVKWQWERSDLPTTGFVDIRGETSDTYTPKMTVEDDPVTTENEGVDGDEGKYLRVTVLYLDNHSPDVAAGTTDDAATANDESKGERLIEQPSANAVREAPDVNQAPVFDSGITREVREDAGDDGNVGKPVTANDPDAGDALSYSISGGADMDAFEIDSTTGQITVKKGSTLDFEGTQTTFMVEVTARDPFGMSDSTTVTIMVTDANEAPELTAPGDPCKQDATTKDVTCDYDENGMDAVGTFTGMDPEGETIVWSLAGDDAADFDITGGELTFKKTPNYESPVDANTDNVYMVDVVATEVRTPGSLDLAQDATVSVTITVKNVEEDASLTLDRLQVRAPDGTNAGSTVTAVFDDPDTRNAAGDTIAIAPAYTWFVPKVNRPDLENDDHWRSGTGTPSGTGNVSYTPAAGEAGKHLRVVATYTDQAGDPDKAYARSVYPVGVARSADDNNAPSFPNGTPSGFTVREDAAVGTVVGTVTGSDVDSNDVLTHALTGSGQDDGLFKIDQATGRITVGMKLDYETAVANDRDGTEEGIQYRVTVTVYDSLAEATPPTRDIDITVTDVNDAPNAPTVGVVTGRTPVDGNGDPTYTVNENHFVEDDSTATPAKEAVILATFTIADTTDPDAGDNIAALKLTTGGPDGSLFSLTDTTDFGGTVDNAYDLVFKESPNYESPGDADGNNRYHVTVITSDNEGATNELPLVITVENVDEDGEVMLSTTQPAVGQPITATLTDPDMKVSEVKWQWERSELPTTGFIDIRGATSDTYTPVMSVEDDPVTSENETVDGDEGKYLRVTVLYLDNHSSEVADGTTDDATTANDESKGERLIEQPSDNAVREAPDVNQAPVFESGITREVREDAGDGGNVGKPVTANDPDGDALAYTISGGADMAAFAIDLASGQITVKKGDTLDFEGTQTTFMVEVTASDPFGLSDSTTVTIMVTDDNEPPEVMLLPGGTTQPNDETVGGRANVSVQEGTSTVGDYTTTISSPTWSLSGVDAGDFSVSGGMLSFRSAPDYEAPADANGDNVYMVTVMASGGGNMAELDVTVTVTDVDESTGFNPLDYDTNNNGTIEKPEMIMAVNAYLFDGTITKAQMIQVINLYLFGS